MPDWGLSGLQTSRKSEGLKDSTANEVLVTQRFLYVSLYHSAESDGIKDVGLT